MILVHRKSAPNYTTDKDQNIKSELLQAGPQTHLASYSMYIVGSFPCGMGADTWSWLSTPSSAKNQWNSTSSMHRDKFIYTCNLQLTLIRNTMNLSNTIH